MYPITDVVVRSLHKGTQVLIFYANGYGASVVKHPYSYGGNNDLFEIAVLKGNKDKFDLCYTTHITDDVIGYLDDEGVQRILYQIQDLSKEG